MDDMKLYYSTDIESIISKAALDVMKQTQNVFVADQRQKVESLTMLNARIAIYNTGVHDLAAYLLSKLGTAKDGGKDD